jgi:hypothetical protein
MLIQLAHSPAISATLKLSFKHTHFSSAFSVTPQPLVSPPSFPSEPRIVGTIDVRWPERVVEVVGRPGAFVPALVAAEEMIGLLFEDVVGVAAGSVSAAVEDRLSDVVGRAWAGGGTVG